jgi:ABC-type multidrug transport system fused ATPase/permease subunit
VLQFLIFGGVLYYALIILKDENTKTGDLPAFLILIKSFRELFGRVKWHREVLVREFADIKRFIDLMEAKPSVISGSDNLSEVVGEIEFKGVWFEYPSRPGEDVLKGLDLKILPQKITAIVGDSGAGKSTISKLLMRLYDPTKGSITLDGKDIKNLDIKNLHTHIGIVNQNPDLFNAPLTDNIGYGFHGESYEQSQIEKASEIANCGFISKFRGKFDTFAGSRGANLSGGQKQRLAIARAAIREPSILILDEATSSLDAENEALVQKALENVMMNRTILIIAHRLSTVKNADNIICMKDGGVVEQGTHATLMSKKGVYYNLVNTQIVEDIKNPQG